MKHWTLGLSLVAALILVGCQNKPTASRTGEGQEPAATSTTGGEPAPNPGTPNANPANPGPEATKPGDTSKPPKNPPPNKPTIDFQVSKPGQKGWGPTKITLAELGGNIAASMKGLRNTSLETTTLARTDEGEGQYMGDTQIKDNKAFKVDYVVVGTIPTTASDISDGVRRMIRLGETYSKPMPAGKPLDVVNRSSAELANRWIQDFGRMAFQGLTDGKDAWKPVFTEWSKGTGGFKPVVEERSSLYKNQLILNYRVRAERTGAAAKKLGQCTIEIVIDGKHFVPVTMRVERTDLKGKKWLTQWSAHWKFRQEIAANAFAMPIPKS